METAESGERERWERARTEWGYVLRKMAEGRRPSREHLARLLTLDPIPEWATLEEREAVYRVIAEGPGKKSMREPEDWGLYGEFTAREASALMELLWLSSELAAFETTQSGETWRTLQTESLYRLDADEDDSSTESVKVRLRYVESRGHWKVRSPKEQARRIIARRYHVAPGTVKGWERKFRESGEPLGEVF